MTIPLSLCTIGWGSSLAHSQGGSNGRRRVHTCPFGDVCSCCFCCKPYQARYTWRKKLVPSHSSSSRGINGSFRLLDEFENGSAHSGRIFASWSDRIYSRTYPVSSRLRRVPSLSRFRPRPEEIEHFIKRITPVVLPLYKLPTTYH